MNKGIYLAAGMAFHPDYDLVYQDLLIKRDIGGDMLDIDLSNIEQRQDFKYGGKVIKYNDMNNQYHQGGYNVHNVIERFLKTVNERYV